MPGNSANTIPSFHALGLSPLEHSPNGAGDSHKGQHYVWKVTGVWLGPAERERQAKAFPGSMRALVSQEASQSISICGGQWPCVLERRRRAWPCWWPCPSLGRALLCQHGSSAG